MWSAAGNLFDTLESLLSAGSEIELAFYLQNVLGGVEGEHYDYKSSASTDGEPTNDDKKNLGKALSGFANTSGGVLVWGVKEVDDSVELRPIHRIARFASSMMELASQATEPAITGLRVATLERDDKSGFAILLVPQSDLPPHRIILKDGKDRYYGRSGSSFVPLSHSQLADLFGRRPRPVLRATVAPFDDGPRARRPHEVRLSIHNDGRGAARMLAFSAWLKTARHETQVEVHQAQEWRVHARGDGERLTLMRSEGAYLHGGSTMKVDGLFVGGLPATNTVEVHVRLLADEIQPTEQVIEVPIVR